MMQLSRAGVFPRAGLALALLAGLGGLSARPARAALFEVNATGTITSVTNGLNYTLNPASVGQSITFHYLFDTSATGYDFSAGSTQTKSYVPSDPASARYGPTAQFGAYSVIPVIPNQNQVDVSLYQSSPGSTQDRVDFTGSGLSVNGTGNKGEAILSLQNISRHTLTSTQLPLLSAFTLANFPNSYFYLTPDSNDSASGRSILSGSVTSLSATNVSSPPAAVPESSTAALVALGLGGLLLRARRQKRA